jgi:hypothetical protein
MNYMPTENPFTALKKQAATNNPFTKLKQEQQDVPDAKTSAAITAGSTLINAGLAAPSASGDLLAAGAAGVRGLGDFMTGGEFDFGTKFEEEQGKFPASAIRSIPRPTIQEIGAGIRSAPGLFGSQPIKERYADELASGQEAEAAMREAHPTATGVGDVLGDVGSLFVTRQASGLPGKMQKLEDLIMKGGKKPDFVFGAIENLDNIKPSAWRFVGDKLIESNGWRNLLKATGRTAETSLEAVALDILNSNDPNDTIAYAAVGQVVGSLGLQALKSTWGSGGAASGVKRLGVAGLVGAGLWQYMQQVTPGGDNSPLESVQVGFEKTLLAITAGAITGILGAGRMRGPGSKGLQDNIPRLADAMTAVPRAAMLSLLKDMVQANKAEQQQAAAALQVMGTRADELSQPMIASLEKALSSGNFVDSVGKLMEDKDFASMIFSVSPPGLESGN